MGSAPAFSGAQALRYAEGYDGFAICPSGNDEGFIVLPQLGRIDDASPLVHYNVYVNGALFWPYVDELASYGASRLFMHWPLATSDAIAPGATIEVRAVDLAGNESATTTPLVVDDGYATTTSGCALSNARGGADRYGWLLLAPAVAALRRRRGELGKIASGSRRVAAR